MAKGLGLADPQYTSPVNPEGNPNIRKAVRGPASWEKYTPRRSVYTWMAGNTGMTGSYDSIGYGTRRRGKKNNDTGSLPEAYLNFIER